MTILPNRSELIKVIPPGTIGAEIGVWRGYFSVELAALPIKKLYLVDAWESLPGPYSGENHASNMSETRGNVRPFGDKVELLRSHSVRGAELVPMLDWIYLDADHTFESVYADLTAWSKKIKYGGAIYGHDYTAIPEAKKLNFGVIEAVDLFCENEGWVMTHITNEPWASYRLERAVWTGAEL